MFNKFNILCLLFYSHVLHAEIYNIGPGLNSQEQLQELMILARPGDTIQLKEGVYELSDGLSLTQNEVSIKGAGMHKTVLDFSEQMSGAQGLLVTSNNVVLKDFAIINTKGDALKVIGADGIYMVNLRTEWTNGPDTSNGAYGLYPVQSKNVYIDGCVAIGASDAGIYVGQSENIIVRNNIAQYNVAGIEIENSYYADVFDNEVSLNTGGILVFDLPDLPQQGGHNIRVFRNQSSNNNTDNFAPKGNIVATVPRGTGILVLANSTVEIFDNEIHDNGSINLGIVSYFEETDDPDYYPHPRSIYIHNNNFSNSGYNPDVAANEMAKTLASLAKEDMPDIFWDGILPLNQMVFGQPEEERIVLGDNGDASFLAIKPIQFLLPFLNPVNRNYIEYQTGSRSLDEVKFKVPMERFN
tara:strand:+ start:5860 stop:7095 length:1236 start_codon:yes stop_codon:yes gene_type:complete